MTRTRFHQGLDDLKQKLLTMGGMAEQAVERAVRAFQTRDVSLCQLVLKDEPHINAAEREVDELSIDLLAMQQPMAVDLRFIIACIKINADLERVGDQAVNIAERVMDMVTYPKSSLNVDVPRMASLTINMVRDALNAFLTADAELAHTVLERDDLVDDMIISRNLERVADHATNIAEDVIFWVRGADVRHHAGGG
jgi:phosphate transport system protein